AAFKCDKCDRALATAAILKMHMRSLCGTRCIKCLKVFKTQLALKQHRLLYHNSSANAPALGEFECKECEARFKSERNLLRHKLHEHNPSVAAAVAAAAARA
ncbi:hypothetical protein PFISCL1PPCAC_12225, partial [Pristionchus fissidentatus]